MSSFISMTKVAKNKNPAASKMPAKNHVQPYNLSTEYVQESDSEEDEKSGTNSTSDDDSLPENPVADMPKGNSQAKARIGDTGSSSGSESQSQSAADSNNEQSEHEQVLSEKNQKKPSVDSGHRRPAPKQLSAKKVSLKKPPPYIPPSGFEVASIDDAQRVSHLLKDSNLRGKEIWYITAPASVSLSSVEELSLLKIQECKEILSHNGDAYAFVPDASEAKSYTKLMVPNSSDDNYYIGKTPISRILHLQQTIPQAKFTADATMPAKRAARQQPPGLKMRFRPVGFDTERTGSGFSDDKSSTESSSDQEMLDTPTATLRKAGSLSTSSESSEGEDFGSHAKTAEAMGTKSRISPGKSSKGAGRSMKRKHSGEENKKSKHSSSRSRIADNRKLKRLKSQVEDQKTTAIRSVSSEARSIASMMLLTVGQSSSPTLPPVSRATKSNTIFDPRPASLTSFAPILPPISSEVHRPSQISLTRPNLTESTSFVARTDTSLIDNQVQAMDLNPAADKRRNDSKRLKRSGISSTSKVKPKEANQLSSDVD